MNKSIEMHDISQLSIWYNIEKDYNFKQFQKQIQLIL